ncbi:MAG: hypothetical protein IH989_06225, partial [Planctomycetes bacterium]|nr:hypothetical protein [Planctomycetota bacterium]
FIGGKEINLNASGRRGHAGFYRCAVFFRHPVEHDFGVNVGGVGDKAIGHAIIAETKKRLKYPGLK